MKQHHTYLIACLLLLAVPACIKEAEEEPPALNARKMDVILRNNYAFSMFYQALVRTGMDTVATGERFYTILAPDNEAFAASGIDEDSLQRMSDTELKQLIDYHILPGSYPFANLPQTVGYPFTSLAGPELYASVPTMPDAGPGIHFNGINVKKRDIMASNGVIHAVEKVLRYPALTVKQCLQHVPQFSRFTRAMEKFGLLDSLEGNGPFVVLAPPNEVFDRYGIDDIMLESLVDTFHYRKLFLNNYVLKDRRFFWSDFTDAPPHLGNGSGAMPPVYLMPDAILEYQYFNFHVIPYTLPAILWERYGETVTVTDADYPSLNGVVHGISGFMVDPDSARIK